MRVNLFVAMSVLMGLVGCEASEHDVMSLAVESNEGVAEARVTEGSLLEEGVLEESLIFDTHQVIALPTGLSIEWVTLEHLPVTEVTLQAFFKQKVASSERSLFILQHEQYLITFNPKSPVFYTWFMEETLTDLPAVLKEVGADLMLPPQTMAWAFFERLESPMLTRLGTGVLTETVDYTPLQEQWQPSKEALMASLESRLPILDLNVSLEEGHLHLQLLLNEATSWSESDLRPLTAQVVREILAHEKAYTLKHLEVEWLVSTESVMETEKAFNFHSEEEPVLMARLDLSIHELFTLPWESQLMQVTDEFLSYFRYYGAPEYE